MVAPRDHASDRDALTPAMPGRRAAGSRLMSREGASPARAFLTALVLYATITGQSPLNLPALPQFPVATAMQERLRDIAAEAVQTTRPRMWCSGDVI